MRVPSLAILKWTADLFQQSTTPFTQLTVIVRFLFGSETHPLKEAFKHRIVEKMLEKSTPLHLVRWMPVFYQVLLPVAEEVSDRLRDITGVLVNSLGVGNKGDQIFHISVLKVFV